MHQLPLRWADLASRVVERAFSDKLDNTGVGHDRFCCGPAARQHVIEATHRYAAGTDGEMVNARPRPAPNRFASRSVKYISTSAAAVP